MEQVALSTSTLLSSARMETLESARKHGTYTQSARTHTMSVDATMACFMSITVVLAILQVMLVRALARDVRGDDAAVPFHRKSANGAGRRSRAQVGDTDTDGVFGQIESLLAFAIEPLRYLAHRAVVCLNVACIRAGVRPGASWLPLLGNALKGAGGAKKPHEHVQQHRKGWSRKASPASGGAAGLAATGGGRADHQTAIGLRASAGVARDGHS